MLRRLSQQHPFAAFLFVTVLWSWGWWIPGVLVYQSSGSPDLPTWMLLVGLIGAYGPSVAAVVVTALRGGRAEVSELFAKLRIWRVGLGNYAIALLIPPSLLILALLSYGLTGGQLGQLDLALDPITLILILLTALPFGPLAEELGWRGFVQPTLQQQFSPLMSGVIVGVIWALWHLPLFWVPGAALSFEDSGQLTPMLVYIINTTALGVLFAILAVRTGGSVLLSILFHLSVNSSGRLIYPLLPDLSSQSISTIHALQVILTLSITMTCVWLSRKVLLVHPQTTRVRVQNG